MKSIISEKEFQTTTNSFFKKFKIKQLLKQSNIVKVQGFSCFEVFKFLFELVFTGKNLFSYLESERNEKPFEKDVCYRFLETISFNWRKLILLLSSKVIASIAQLTADNRENVIIIDDSFYGRQRSKKVELLATVFDHTDGKYKRGFRMLTAAWSDGNTLIPLAFSLLSSQEKKNRHNESKEGIDKRSNGAKRRKEAISKATDITVKLLREIKSYCIPAKTVLFDSWFSFPKTICEIVEEGFQVIAMLKKVKNVMYTYEGKKYTLVGLYKILKKRRGKAKLLASVVVMLEHGNTTIPSKIVFVRNKNKKKDWLALISTNIQLDDQEVVRIYGKRWDIEVFFKMTKSYLKLAKEFQCRSYDAMTAHTSLVFIRYTMLSLVQRENKDYRSFGALFFFCYDELQDVTFSDSFQLLISCFLNFLRDNFLLPLKLIDDFLEHFILSLPSHIKCKLLLSRCES